MLCFEDFVGAAALGLVHGSKMEEIILGVVCKKFRLAVSPVWFLLGRCPLPSRSSVTADGLVYNQCRVVWLPVLV